ncbi:hypothetical protein ACUNWD_06100 [Sunxiuqinia sp. A32]|uniref:hypothetical protein n=1 Tax=Sunxiuqinia sp. A32 TaxID=3461496 RepID=UPI004045DEBD
MKRLILLTLTLTPTFSFAQNEVGSDGDKLLVIILCILILPVLFYFLSKWRKSRPGYRKPNFSFHWKKLKVSLDKDRKYRPRFLTLRVENVSSRDVDIEAPVLYFRKIWSKRKFKLKGINRYEIYPLYLETAKTHELRVDLNVFHQHDRKLRKYYWAKIRIYDTKGNNYSSKIIALRKSLFS